MKSEVTRYLKRECVKRKLSAYYLPDTDTYVIHRKGRAVMNMSLRQFYEIPKLARNRMWNPLIKVGMAHNLGESYKSQVVTERKMGIKII